MKMLLALILGLIFLSIAIYNIGHEKLWRNLIGWTVGIVIPVSWTILANVYPNTFDF